VPLNCAITFNVNAPSHDFALEQANGNTYTQGVTGAPIDVGVITWVVANDAPLLLYYYCVEFPTMNGTINVAWVTTSQQTTNQQTTNQQTTNQQSTNQQTINQTTMSANNLTTTAHIVATSSLTQTSLVAAILVPLIFIFLLTLIIGIFIIVEKKEEESCFGIWWRYSRNTW